MTFPDKKQLRKHVREHLKKLSQAQRDGAGVAIARHMEDWLSHGPTLESAGLFMSLPDELNTRPLEKALHKRHIRHYIPWIVPERGMVFIDRERLRDLHLDSDLSPNCFLKSLPETLDVVDILDISGLSAIFVPGLAFDQKGGRLGRGQGHYDRALSSMVGMAKKPLFIGLAMDVQIVAQVPLEEHDVFMDYLCTPNLGLCKII